MVVEPYCCSHYISGVCLLDQCLLTRVLMVLSDIFNSQINHKYMKSKTIYKIGDLVKLTSTRPILWNPEGAMDCFLGSTQKIKHFGYHGRPVFESSNTQHWSFQISDIESVVNPYPKVMWVSDHGDNWKKRVVLTEKCGKFIAWITAETIEDAEKQTETISWRQAKEELEIVELTIPEIAKALGLQPEQIRIKE